ncbi:MAG: nitrous oxide reductase accessory protein NosL [Smithella sp.]
MKSTRRKIIKKIIFSIIMAFSILSGSFLWAANDDAKKIPACIHCGMNRETFAHSRMLIVYNDGSKIGFCSLHCAALNMALNLDKTPSIIGVGDYNKKQLIDAEKAVWVIGGNKQGVMTQNAKWAFAEKADAEKYLAENGGRIVGFDEVLQTAYEDLGRDTRMIREKRKMTKMKEMSEKIH